MSDRGRGFPVRGEGDEPTKLIVFEHALRTQLRLPNRQSAIPTQDLLRGPVYLGHSAVAIGDDHAPGELVEGPHSSGGFPTQLAKLGM